MAKPEKFVFMKVGMHAGEPWESILERKREEFRVAGKTFWGYGGATCHPLRQVQPFVKSVLQDSGGQVSLLMEMMDSKADPDIVPATEYSDDGLIWRPIPKGVTVTGSSFAIILGEIQETDLDIPLDEYSVGYGKSRGVLASQYIQRRIDKACLELASARGNASRRVHVTYTAPILEPYAVLLRGGKG